MNRLRNYFEGTTRDILFTCPACSTSNEIPDQPLDTRTLEADGFKLVDGAWSGLCEDCKAKAGDADNTEYDAIVRAASELGRLHRVSPLMTIDIPTGEGFDREGERRFGFWAVPGYTVTGGSSHFRTAAVSVCESINRKMGWSATPGTGLMVNINDTGTQAIIHGIND